MAYPVNDNPELTKIRCDMCQKFIPSNKIIERYDPECIITGWDGKPAQSLKTLCSKSCEEKYFREN